MEDLSLEIKGFLKKAGLVGYDILPLAGDASDRKYYRLKQNKHSLVLMDSSKTIETMNSFVNVRNYLSSNQFSVPEILNVDIDNGFIVLEDFGDNTLDKYLVKNPKDTKKIYKLIVDLVISLNNLNNPPFLEFNKQFFLDELAIFTRWYMPLIDRFIVDNKINRFNSSWDQALEYLLKEDKKQVFVHKDLHCGNLFRLPNRSGVRKLGIIDFQAAKRGSMVYDITSFLYDCRLPLQKDLRDNLIERYMTGNDWNIQKFQNLCDIYIAQRNIKILGNFAYLYKEKGNGKYLNFLPNVWEYVNKSLENPILKEVKTWFKENNIKLFGRY
ncbi:hypothetical protein A2Z67_01975 [Candidatus Woesebacteria bacterium RBG_13_36_22]|uniref:Aminoglycoside phosphotransferase domain-containing protein n=1 Tax=Candidatus Woesebacteria bacterium RBG_13_36_22 TaxID=1802478 RepID=A0A1F7X6L5_9BACT|nr:MAG: hypothetical protein A2Z67_01975 [Candidatus Woesebacteria bacterium RBG_13_36_22]